VGYGVPMDLAARRLAAPELPERRMCSRRRSVGPDAPAVEELFRLGDRSGLSALYEATFMKPCERTDPTGDAAQDGTRPRLRF
jgi:hypothetical protein